MATTPDTHPQAVDTATDFMPLPRPSERMQYRGIDLSRSSVLRLADESQIKLVRLRITGRAKGRTFILRESLDEWIGRQLACAK